MKQFVVLTRGRTGSTPIVADINQHPAIDCHQEVFRSEPVVSPQDMALSFVGEAMRSPGLTAEQYVSGLAVQSSPGAQAVGFKLLLNQIDERGASGLMDFLLSGRLLVVFLSRDPIRSALSAAIAKGRNAYNWHQDTQDAAYRERLNLKVNIDLDFVKTEATYYEYWATRWLDDLRGASVPHIHITYEEYEADRLGLINRVFGFVGVPSLSALEPNPYARVTKGEVWDNVANTDEVRALLA